MFAGAARHGAAFAREPPRFLAAIWRVFDEYELAGGVDSQKPALRGQLPALLYKSRRSDRADAFFTSATVLHVRGASPRPGTHE